MVQVSECWIVVVVVVVVVIVVIVVVLLLFDQLADCSVLWNVKIMLAGFTVEC
jgi:hypothetical protein